jgi:cob(I)alamin adenosyltransferase
MKIYTRTGDKGKTSLLGGTRVLKNHARINAYGTVDELNSFLGLVSDLEIDIQRIKLIRDIQSRLFTVGASLAAETERAADFKPDLTDEDVVILEQAIDEMNETLPELKNFIIPGGHQLVSTTHIARTICRRVERLVIELAEHQEIEQIIIIYLNRLSDYLFILARKQAFDLKIEEIPWRPRG